MNKDAQQIMLILEKYLIENPSIRFGQALFNLGINEFQDKGFPERCNRLLRDIYNDSDRGILARVNEERKRNGLV